MKKWGPYLAAVLLVLSVATAYAVSHSQNFTISVTSVFTPDNSIIIGSGNTGLLATPASGTYGGVHYSNLVTGSPPTITDNTSDAWTLVNGTAGLGVGGAGCTDTNATTVYQVAQNGVTRAESAGVEALLWYGSKIYQMTCWAQGGVWYVFDPANPSAGFVLATNSADPRLQTPPITVTAGANTIWITPNAGLSTSPNGGDQAIIQGTSASAGVVPGTGGLNGIVDAFGDFWNQSSTTPSTCGNAGHGTGQNILRDFNNDPSHVDPAAGPTTDGVIATLAFNGNLYHVTCYPSTVPSASNFTWWQYVGSPTWWQNNGSTDPRAGGPVASTSILYGVSSTATLTGPIPPSNCGGTRPCNSTVVTSSIPFGGHTWTLTSPVTGCNLHDVNGRTIVSGTTYSVTSDLGTTGNSILALITTGSGIYQATCNYINGNNASGHIQWYKWSGSGLVWNASSDPRLLCNTDNGAGGGGEPPITCVKLLASTSMYNSPIPGATVAGSTSGTGCTAGPGCYYPSSLGGWNSDTGNLPSSADLQSTFGTPEQIFQATTTDPYVPSYANTQAYCYNNGASAGCPASCLNNSGVAAAHGNGATFDTCATPGGTGESTLLFTNYAGSGTYNAVVNASAGNGPSNNVAPDSASGNCVAEGKTGGCVYRKQYNPNVAGNDWSGLPHANAQGSDNTVRFVWAPTNAYRGVDSDGVVSVMQPDGTMFESTNTTKLDTSHGGAYISSSYSIFDIQKEAGDGFTNGLGSSYGPETTGALTQRDVNNGNNSVAIDHGFRGFCGNGLLGVTASAPWAKYPAYGHDNGNGTCPPYGQSCTSGPSNSVMGQHYYLPESAVRSSGWANSVSGPALEKAMNLYGVYCMDLDGSSSAIGVLNDPNITDSNWTPAATATDLSYIGSHMRRISVNMDCTAAGHPGNCPQ